MSCRVSDQYLKDNTFVFGEVLNVLNTAKIPYWLDAASLLAVLRNQTSFNIWDHDVDLSIEYPEEIENFTPLFASFHTKWDESRDVLQVYYQPSLKGPHTDIWLWTKGTWRGNNALRQKANKPYTFDDVFPLQTVNWTKFQITIPRRAKKLAGEVFGESYMTAVHFRMDCVHNFYNGRLTY